MSENDSMNVENWVYKSNAIIQHKGRMTALQQKIIAVLASAISPEDEDFKDYEFSIKEFIEITGTNETAIYNQMHDAAKGLMEKVLHFRRGKSRISVPVLGFVETVEGQGKIIMRFDKSLKEEYLGLQEVFTKYRLKEILNLKSTHAIRIYELVKQWQYSSHKSVKYDVQELKDMLGIGEEYSAFKDFERRVLKPAKEEINEKSDIWMDYKKIRSGRSIAKIEFTMESKYGTLDSDEEEIRFYKKHSDPRYEYFREIRERTVIDAQHINDMQLNECYEIAVKATTHPTIDIDVYEYMRLNYEYTIKNANKGIYAYFKKALESDYAKAKLTILGF